MDFELSEPQEMLRKLARDFLATECPKKLVRAMEEDETGHPIELWQKMAELGWQGLAFPEEYGGGGGTFLDLTVLLEEMGRACLPGPFFATVMLGGLPILDYGTEEQKREFLPKVTRGEMILSLALTELAARYDASDINVKAVSKNGDYILNGTKLFVPYAHLAHRTICVARTKKGTSPEEGVTLFLVDNKNSGLKWQMLLTMAHDKQCELSFDSVKVPRRDILGKAEQGWGAMTKIMEKAALAKCAEMVGEAQQVLEMSVSYAKERVQFGRPIGSFQAIQHHCANMTVDVEGARFITYKAAWLLSEGLPCSKETSMAKAWVNESSRRVALLGHQIHGAIGYTWDHDMQLYSRRLRSAELVFGDADFHREMVARSW